MKRSMMLMAAGFLAAGMLVLPVVAEELDPPAIAGMWMIEGEAYALEIGPCEQGLCGTVVWAADESLLGQVVLTDVSLDTNGKGAHKDGEFVDPVADKTYYRCELLVDDEGRLRVEGQVGVMRRGRPVLSRFATKLHFVRVRELPAG